MATKRSRGLVNLALNNNKRQCLGPETVKSAASGKSVTCIAPSRTAVKTAASVKSKTSIAPSRTAVKAAASVKSKTSNAPSCTAFKPAPLVKSMTSVASSHMAVKPAESVKTMTSIAPSLSASEEKNMCEVFKTQRDSSPVNVFQKCSEWLVTNGPARYAGSVVTEESSNQNGAEVLSKECTIENADVRNLVAYSPSTSMSSIAIPTAPTKTATEVDSNYTDGPSLNVMPVLPEEASNTDPKLISGEESSNALAKPAKVDSHIYESLNLYPILTEQVYPDNTNMISILESSFEFVKPSNVDSNNNSQYLNSVPSLPDEPNSTPVQESVIEYLNPVNVDLCTDLVLDVVDPCCGHPVVDPILVTPEDSIREVIPQKLPGGNNDGPSLRVISSSSRSVRKNLFPSDPGENIEHLDLRDISDNDLNGALILPLEEQVLMEDVFTVEVVQENQEDSLMEVPETEERDINPNVVKKRKRTYIAPDKTPPRKRLVTPANWKRTKAKVAYNAGLAHTSKKGIPKRARCLKPPCKETCRKLCFSRVSPELRQKLFDKYWTLNQDKTAQWLFLAKLIRIVPIKQRKVNIHEDEEPWRKHTYEYYLKDLETEEDLISVCQTMFLNTFDVSTKVIKTALMKNSPDKRGRHSKHKKLCPEIVQSVKDHIKKYPLVQSHYCRADTQKRYLDENLSVAKMYRMYLMDREEGAPKASERNYRDIFNTCFNLSFFKPKKDQCSLCTGFDAPNAVNSQEKIMEYNKHREEKQKVRKLKMEDKLLSREEDNSNIRVVTFDLQKILYCPKGEIAEFYYKRKLSSFNSTLFDCTVKQGYCYVWDLTIGKKGADEVATFLYDYIKTMVEKGINDFRLYSDSCTGQNKNRFLFSMYYFAAMKFKIKITHRWLVKGHTQMECDNVHARIEKKTKKLDIYTPSQWYGSIRTAKVKKPQYIVKEVNKDIDILTFRPLDEYFSWNKVPIMKLRSLTVDFNDPQNVSCQNECDGPVTKYSILKKKVGRPVNWATLKINKAYSGKLPLKAKLVEDLKWFIKKGFIPDAHLDFFRYVIEDPAVATITVDDEEDEEDDVPQEITPPPGGEIIWDEDSDDDDEPQDVDDPVGALANVHVEAPASDEEVSDEEDDDDD